MYSLRRPALAKTLLEVCALIVALCPVSAEAGPPAAVTFDIPAGPLADALDRFGEQSGLHVVYVAKLVDGLDVPAVVGTMPPAQALDRFVAEHAGIAWAFVNEETVALRPIKMHERGRQAEPEPPPRETAPPAPTLLSEMTVVGDPRRILPTTPSATAFGFDKPLLETPRSVSAISEESIDLFGLSAVEDLVRVVPGVYTTTRFGIQGAVDVRNVSADTYFRGMKRLNLQGHGRSVLAATDAIEVVRGPPSPIYGMGKIGGYTNVIPKTARAGNGAYLSRPQGFAAAVAGSYDRAEVSFGVGGPLRLRERPAGYYVYGLFEDSGSYSKAVPVEQELLQLALSADDFSGGFRLETGVHYQQSTTAGALLNRVTQNLVDDGRYVRGSPLADLDANGNGKIGYLEMHAGSPALGALSSNNLPLRQTWAWPTDADGTPVPLGTATVPGIPQAMYDYLVAHPEADPTGLLRAQGPGGPLPLSGYVPIGMVLDPRTVGYDTLDPRRAGAFERELGAEFVTAYFDLIRDNDPAFTMRNQLFFDAMDQYKISEQPGGGKQDVRVIEDKFTMTRQLGSTPAGLDVEALLSLNVRDTRSSGYRYGGDFGSHRTDAMRGDGTMTPNTTFVHPFDNADTSNDGAPWTSAYRSDYSEAGVGILFDIDIRERTNVLVGARRDYSRAKNVERAGTFDPFTGTSAAPGAVTLTDERTSGSDSGSSWSLSVLRRLRGNLRPYATIAESSLTLEANNNRLPNTVIRNGHIGKAQLREVGVKTSVLGDRLFLSLARYDQGRIGVEESDDPALLVGDASSTQTDGWEVELKWVPHERLFLSFYAQRHETRFSPNVGEAILVDARALGFQDIVDAEGNVVYPAEAFLYGGRAFVTLPSGMEQYARKQGNPETQLGFAMQYELGNGLGFTLSGNAFSRVYSGRLQWVKLPAARVANAGVFWQAGDWHIKLDVLNLFDERYFRARTGDTLSDTLVSAMPERHWELAVRSKF